MRLMDQQDCSEVASVYGDRALAMDGKGNRLCLVNSDQRQLDLPLALTNFAGHKW